MSPFTKIAWRNIARNRTRSAVVISAVAVGLCALIFLKSFVDGADQQMVANYTDLLLGHIQVHKAGFQENMGPENSIVNATVITSAFKKIPEITGYAPRIKGHALISSAEGSSAVLLLGVDPAAETKISSIPGRIRRGSFLKNNEDGRIVIGKTLAENLQAGLGDKVVLISQASDGSLATAAYEVCGIIESGAEEIDKGLALITLNAAQELLVMGSKISEIAVKTSSLDAVDAAAALLKSRVDARRFEVLTWKEVSPATYQWLQLDQIFTMLVLFIVLFIVASGIFNTVLLGALERTREFGVMGALGTRPVQIGNVVALESFLLGFIGVLIGTGVGTGLVFAAGIKGVDLSAVSGALGSFYIGPVIYPRMDVLSIAFYASVVLVTSLAVSVFPARKAARLSPLEALKH